MAALAEAGHGSLHFGDTVLFLNKTKDYQGYVYSELSSSPFLTVYNLKEHNEKNPDFPNIAFASFKIMAPNKYKAKQQLKQVQQDPESQEYRNALRAFKTEEAENKLEQKRHFGSRVFYGDSVQLQHVASKKFVKVCSEASKTESNNLLVSLSEENFEECIFKILPRYKVRSEGDEVRYNDQLKIENIKNQGQYLHCSGPNHTLGTAKFNVLTDCFELNLSATESALTLIPHYSSSANKHPDKALRAGTCVRLFHKEDECYIVAEGSFAFAKESFASLKGTIGDNRSDPIIEDVHCRVRRVDSRKHAAPSTSSNTYWQIEKQEDPRSGDVIAWRDRCRLKHLPTRCYLAVMKVMGQWKVTLKEKTRDNDLDTIFSFSPLIEEGEEVLLESYALIQHRLSGQWLHLEKKYSYTRKGFDPKAKGLAGLEWDSAELLMLTTSKDRGDYDSFTLQEVTEDLVDRFNYVAGIVPMLTGYIKQLHSKTEGKQKQLVRVKNALVDLKNWIIDDKERNTKNNQKLLRNLRVLEQLHEILKFAEDDTFKGSSLHITICRECYNVIKTFLEGDSRKNENYLAHFIEFFQQHVRKELNAEEVLVEIVQDNITIVSKMADTRLGHMIDQFSETKDPRFLHFLGSLCVCSNRPIPSTQNRLLHELVKIHGEEKFLKTKLDRASQEIYCYHPSSPHQNVSLKALSKDNNAGFYHLLKGQLYLMARLCQGNNKEAINALVHTEVNPDGYISFDEAITCAKESEIDSKLRKYYIKLILVMFVDFGNNRSFLDSLCYSFVYDDLVPVPYSESGGSQVKALTGAENEHFPALKDWILNTISNNTNLRCESKENSLLKLVLDVLGHLVRYGYYDDIEDVDELLGPLTELLNGETDLPSERKMSEVDFRGSTRKKDIPENKGVFDVKVKALEVMELLYRFKFYVKLQKFMYDFQQTQKPERKGRIEAIIDELAPDPLDTLSKLVDVDSDSEDDNENDEKWYSHDIMDAVQEHISDLCGGNVKGGGFAPPNTGGLSLELVLLDLSGYECDELVTGSLNLLTHMYFFEEELFSKAQQSQLLKCDRSLNDFNTVKNEILPVLWQLLRVDASGTNQEQLVSILRQLQSLCVFSSSHLPNKQNQIMLDNFGIVSHIMSFLFEKSDGRMVLRPAAQGERSGSVGEDLFNNCFLLLQYLSVDNMNVKKRIFNRLDDLLQMKLPNATLPFLADLITEVFTGGPELIMKVEDDQIEKIFEIIISCNYPMAQAQFVVALEAIVKIEEVDLPVGQNQATIIKNFCKLRETFCPDLLGESSEVDALRVEILESSEGSSCPDPRLQLLLNLTDMLAACAEGGNLFIESVCQNIFGIDDLIEIISSELPPNCKRPFLRFLTMVYMNTDGDNSSSQNSLSNGILMWTYLRHLANILENVSKVLSHTSSSDIKILKQELQTNSRRKVSQSSYPPTPSAAEPVPTIGIVDLPNVTDSHGHLVPGLLEYLADGVIPFLNTFYSHFYDPSTSRLDDCSISANILRSLVDLSKDLTGVLSSDKHVYMFQETISALMNYSEIREKSTVSKEQSIHAMEFIGGRAPRKKSSSLKRLEKTDSEAYEELLEEYVEQEKLNELFNCFSQRYHCSYMGPNTAGHQIGSTVHCKIEYSDEGEELPMGPSFQELIKIYHIDKSSSEKHPAERLLKQIEISVSRSDQLGEAEQINQDKLDLRCLQILRALIHNKIKHIDPELKERDPKEFRKKCKDTVVPVQESIQSFNNAISRVIPLLLHPDETISKEALALMKALLYSGNKEVQKGLIKAVKLSHEEKLFLNFKKRLEVASLNFKEIVELEAQLKKRKKLQHYSLTSPPVSARLTGEHASIGFESEAAVTYTSGKDVIIPMEETVGAHEDENPLLSTESIRRSKASRIASPGLESATEFKRNTEFKLLSDILHHDALWINLVLEVIGLMCDGQNRTLQDYLREQLDNYRTTNVVAEVVAFLHTFATDLSLNNLEQISTVIHSLIELCVGNIRNQDIAFNKLVMDPVNRILQLQLKKHDDCLIKESEDFELIKRYVEVKGSVVELLDVMLEEISPQTLTLAKGIGSSLDVNSVLLTMKMFHELQSLPLIKEEKIDDDCERGRNKAYQVLVTLMEYKAIDIKNEAKLMKRAEAQSCKEALNSCIECSHSIEIHYEEDGAKPIIARVHFPFKAKLREVATELVRWNINRDSMEDKQRALVDLMPALKIDVLHQTKLKETKVMKPFLAYPTVRSRLLMLLTIILNIFVLFVYTVPDKAMGNNRVFLPNFPFWFFIVFYTVGAAHLFLSFWVIVEYFLINWPHFKLPGFVYSLRAEIDKVIHKDKGGSTYKAPQLTCIDVGIFSVSTIYMVLFLICSILSLAFRGYFYCFCLLFIIVNNDILKRVLRSVTKNGMSLIWLAVLGVIVMFIYAVISFAFLQNYYVETDDAALYCANLGQCMYSVLRYGLTDNLGILIPFQRDGSAPNFTAGVFTARLIFDISFFIIVTTIGLNIVFGIIVDTFSELREERNNIETDQKSKCFICDVASYDFERRAEGFSKHIKDDHNMWNYVYYSLYLDSIDIGDHNAIQKYVYELMLKNNTGFFPQEEACCLIDEEDTDDKIDELEEKVEEILRYFREKEHKKSLSVKRQEQNKWEEQVLKGQSSSYTTSNSFDQQ